MQCCVPARYESVLTEKWQGTGEGRRASVSKGSIAQGDGVGGADKTSMHGREGDSGLAWGSRAQEGRGRHPGEDT